MWRPAILCFHWLQIASSAACSTDGVGSCAQGSAADDTSLLQQRQRLGAATSDRASPDLPEASQGGDLSRPTQNFNRAVTFQGMGFLSLADFTGATMGFLHVLRKKHPRADMTELFSNFGTVSGISGGSWFTQMAIFSSSFMQMVENGAKFPFWSGTLYNVMQSRWLTWPTIADHKLHCANAVKQLAKDLLNKLKHDFPILLHAGHETGKVEGPTSHFEEDVKARIAKLRENVENMPSELDDVKNEALKGIEKLENSTMPDLQDIVQKFADQAPNASVPEDFKKLPSGRLVLEYTIVLMGLLLTTGGMSWVDFMRHIFLKGSGIDPSETLGTDKFNAWAAGKKNLLVTTVVTPPGADLFTGSPSPEQITFYNIRGTSLSYTGQVDWAEWLQPAMFSSVVGAGAEQASPHAFDVAPKSDAYTPQWHLNGDLVGQSRPLRDRFATAFEKDVGKVSIVDASSSSSAFLGEPGLEHSLSMSDCLVFSTWTADVGGGRTYAAAEDIRDKVFNQDTFSDVLLKEVSDLSPMPLIDGAMTDGTGIATAVAAGATDIFGWLDYGPGLLQLFAPSDEPRTAIFKSPNHTEVTAMYKDFPFIAAKEGSKFLKRIAYGVINCTTTSNPYFGISKNHHVKLTVFSIEQTNISMGQPTPGFANFFDYGTLVNEIVEAMVDSPQTETLLSTAFGLEL